MCKCTETYTVFAGWQREICEECEAEFEKWIAEQLADDNPELQEMATVANQPDEFFD